MRYRCAVGVCSALLCISPVHAEEGAPWAATGGSSVTLYGSIDEAVEYITNQAVGKSTTS